MPEFWVANASPLICLAKAGRLDLLDQPGVELLIPEAVTAEIAAGPEGDPARTAIAKGLGKEVHVEQVPVAVLEWSLGPGESAVLAAALEQPGRTALLDDAEARACAKALGIPLMGTLGIALRALHQGKPESAEQIIDEFKAAGLYLDERTIAAFLKCRPQ